MFRHSEWDALLVLLGVLHGVLLILRPSLPLLALGLWWNSNTVAHYFLHLPFFRKRWLNRCFSLFLSVLLGIPQRLWRDRHLAHHAGRKWRLRFSSQLLLEAACVGVLWAGFLWRASAFFWATYLPGWLLGLGLCQLHGYYEHAQGTTSHYSGWYNLLFFNDGFHVEHHRHPTAHWKTLPGSKLPGESDSRWPACLRWLERLNLESLEKMVLRSRWLQRLVLHSHKQAFKALLPAFRGARTVVIVGGGLFPRTALILAELLPNAEITVVDRNLAHIHRALPLLPAKAKVIHQVYSWGQMGGADLTVIPLSFAGDRGRLLETDEKPDSSGYWAWPAAAGVPMREPRWVLIHDWIWRPRGQSAVVSLLLLKRMNLFRA